MQRFLGALSALFICASAFGQGGAVSGQVVKSVSGQAATVRVCTSNATGTPCAPTATIYSDEGLTIQKDNPAATDIQGRYTYFAQPGSYKEQVTVNGITTERVVTVYATKAYVDAGSSTPTGTKHGRVSTGSIAGADSAAIALTWGTSFADTNYTVSCSVVQADTATTTLRIHHIESQSTTGVVVRVVNDNSTTAKTGTLNCVALHD